MEEEVDGSNVKVRFMANVPKSIMSQVIADMADFLIGYGFEPKNAFKVSEEFWNRHKGKLGEIYK
jgi:hypothetical protein